MKHTTNRRGPVIALVVAAALILTACSGSSGDVDTIDVSTTAKARDVACNKVADVAGAIAALDAEAAPGKRKQLEDWGLDPNERDNIADVRNRLAERQTLCEEENDEVADAEPSETASPTPSPTASVTPSASPDPEETENPDNEECASTGDVRQWSQLLDHEELKETITSASDEIGFRWSDVRTWASDYEQDCKGARVILVFDKPNLSNETARQRVDAKPDVPVLRVGSCRVINDDGDGCTTKRAVRVILAPLVIEDGAAVGLRSGVGVTVDKNHAIYVYTTQ